MTGPSLSLEDRCKLQLLGSLKRGLVFKLAGNIPFNSPHPHHFVVLNFDPNTESLIIAPHATSQWEIECEKAVKQGEDVEKTVVYIKTDSYPFFPKATAFNCNEVKPLAFGQLVTAMVNGLLEIKDYKLTERDLDRLIAGVLASKQTTPVIKKQVLPD